MAQKYFIWQRKKGGEGEEGLLLSVFNFKGQLHTLTEP